MIYKNIIGSLGQKENNLSFALAADYTKGRPINPLLDSKRKGVRPEWWTS